MSAFPLLSAVLYTLAFPKFNQSYLAYIALLPLARYALRVKPGHAFYAGWAAGTAAYAALLYWIVVTFQAAHLSAGLAVLCLLLLSAYLGLFWGAWAWFICICPNIFAGAAAWVALEYLRTHLFSGFSWVLLADSQVGDLPRIQTAIYTGVYGISFLVVLANLALATRKMRIIFQTAFLLLALYMAGVLHLREQTPLSGRLVHVALLQGDIDQYKKWNTAYVDEVKQTYEHLVSQASAWRPNLIVWPETSVPGYLLQDPPLHAWLIKTIQKSDVSHLIGAPVLVNEKAYNSAFSIDRKGSTVGEYDKMHLVPFGEVVPWSRFLGRYIRVLNDLGGFTAGSRSPVVMAAGVPIAVNICYEAIFPDLVRRSVLAGGAIIANLTNDGWYMKTAAPYQHWAPNIFRAVENDRWVIRADNTGISGIIDPTGRVIASSGIFEPAIVRGTVQTISRETFYTRHGDLFAWGCCLLCGIFALLYILGKS